MSTKKETPENRGGDLSSKNEDKKKDEARIDAQLEQSFPASDPPYYSKPGNDFRKNKKHHPEK